MQIIIIKQNYICIVLLKKKLLLNYLMLFKKNITFLSIFINLIILTIFS